MDAEFRVQYRTFPDWRRLVARQREHYESEGQQIVEVMVTPDRPVRHLESTSAPHNAGTLASYAKLIGSRGGH